MSASRRSKPPPRRSRPRSQSAMPRPRTMCRFAASWRRPCSICRCGPASPMPRCWRRRGRSPPTPDALKPLEMFAATGIPSPNALNRELLALLPKLSPAQENSTTGSGIVDRLQAGAARLVRIERTDGVAGNDRNAIVSRVTAAATAQRYRRGAARAEDAGARRSRGRAILHRQGRCPRRCIGRIPSIRGRRNGRIHQTGPVGS